MKKRISFLMAVIMILAVMVTAIPVSAAEKPNSDISDGFWSAVDELAAVSSTVTAKTIPINNAADFVYYYQRMGNMHGGRAAFQGHTVQLQADIDLNGEDDDPTDDIKFTTDTTANNFYPMLNGTFDGNNHTISGFYFDNSKNATSSNPDAGFFSGVVGSTTCVLKNLTLDNFTIIGGSKLTDASQATNGTGVFFGKFGSANNTGTEKLTIEGCTATNGTVYAATTKNTAYAAVGVIGAWRTQSQNMCSLTITNTKVADTVKLTVDTTNGGVGYVGGIVGIFSHRTNSYTPTLTLTGSSINPRVYTDKADYDADVADETFDQGRTLNNGAAAFATMHQSGDNKFNFVIGSTTKDVTGYAGIYHTRVNFAYRALVNKGTLPAELSLSANYKADKDTLTDDDTTNNKKTVRIATAGDFLDYYTDTGSTDGRAKFAGVTIQLQGDIDLTGIKFGGSSFYSALNGTFDGNCYTISNFFFDNTINTGSGNPDAGFFSGIAGSTNCALKNLTLDNFTIIGGSKLASSQVQQADYGTGVFFGNFGANSSGTDTLKIDKCVATNGAVKVVTTADNAYAAVGVIGAWRAQSASMEKISMTNTVVDSSVRLITDLAKENGVGYIGGLVGIFSNRAVGEKTDPSHIATLDLTGSSINPTANGKRMSDAKTPASAFGYAHISQNGSGDKAPRVDGFAIVDNASGVYETAAGDAADGFLTAINAAAAAAKVYEASKVTFVGAQIRGEGEIRFVGIINNFADNDRYNFGDIGFNVAAGGVVANTNLTSISKLYRTVLSVNEAKDIPPANYKDKAYFTFVITGIGEDDVDREFTVSAFVKNADETVCTSFEYTFTYNQIAAMAAADASAN